MFGVEYSDFDDLRKQFGNMRKWDRMHLGFEIVNATFKFFDIKRKIKKFRRKPWDLKGLIIIIFLDGLKVLRVVIK